MPKIIVYVSGGVVQDILSDTEGIEVLLLNYDDEEEENCKNREFRTITSDADHVNHTIEGIEDTCPCRASLATKLV